MLTPPRRFKRRVSRFTSRKHRRAQARARLAIKLQAQLKAQPQPHLAAQPEPKPQVEPKAQPEPKAQVTADWDQVMFDQMMDWDQKQVMDQMMDWDQMQVMDQMQGFGPDWDPQICGADEEEDAVATMLLRRIAAIQLNAAIEQPVLSSVPDFRLSTKQPVMSSVPDYLLPMDMNEPVIAVGDVVSSAAVGLFPPDIAMFA